MKPFSPRLSIGTTLALRYALTLSAVLVVFAVGVSSLVERRINREAGLVLEVQLADLVSDYGERSRVLSPEELDGWFDGHARTLVRGADRSLGLGIELLDREGARRSAHGSLRAARVPLDRRLLAGDRDEALRVVNLGGEHAFLCMTKRLQDGFLRVTVDTRRFAENAKDIRRIFQWSVPGVLAIAVLTGWLLARSALRPLVEINRAARGISADADGAVPLTGSGDELDQLALTLNDLMTRIRTGVERQRRFGENVAHELRSPLNRISQHLDLLRRETSISEEGLASLQRVGAEVATMSGEIEAMLRLARFEEGLRAEQRRPVELAEVVEHVTSFFEAEAEESNVRLETRCEEGLRVEGDREWLQTALSNLVSNALKYAGKGGSIRIQADRRAELARIRVSDRGPGLPPDELERVFERFGRTSQTTGSSGFGLGLPIAREIALAHGGRLVASPTKGGGATFTMMLPALH